MRILLSLLVLIFSFQSFVKADDISEFEIEGMSIGDSLLDYFSEEDINNANKHQYIRDNLCIFRNYVHIYFLTFNH